MTMDNIRIIIMNIFSAVMGFLAPIHDFMIGATLIFIANFFVGLIADVIHGNGWETKKALTFVLHCFIFFGLATFLFTCGHYLHDGEGAIQCVSYICHLAFLIYVTNIIRNLKSVIAPNSGLYQILDFSYYVLSFKFVERLPYLRDWKDWRNGNNNDNSQVTQ